MGRQVKPPSVTAAFHYRHQLEFQLLRVSPDSLLMAGKVLEASPSSWAPATRVQDLDRVPIPSFWPSPDSTLAAVANWGVDQGRNINVPGLSLPVSPCLSSKKEKQKER